MPRTRGEIIVKVAKTGGLVQEVCLNGGRTVEDALKASGIDYDEDTKIRVNGGSSELEDELKNKDIVTLSDKIEGGLA